MQKPITALTLAYALGLLLGFGFLYFPYSIGVLIALGILTLGLLSFARRVSCRRFLFLALSCLAGAAAFVYSAAWFPSHHVSRIAAFDRALHDVTGRIASPLDRDPDRTGFTLAVNNIDGRPATGKLRVSLRGPASTIGFDDAVRLKGRIYEAGSFVNPGGFDYAAYLARNGISAAMNVRDEHAVLVLSPGKGLFRSIQNLRERIRQAMLASTSGAGSAILQAMILGEEGGLTDEMRDRFMAAGVTHIISISGSHLGMVAVLCFGLIRGALFAFPERFYHRLTLRTDPRKIAAWLTLPLVLFYTLLAGGQTATVRSLIMITAGLAALILDREHALMHSLALAALLILAASPQALFDISFQLSFVSVLVISAVAGLWNELGLSAVAGRKRFLFGTALLMVISIATSLATGPLVAFYFNQVSLAGVLANIVVIPFAGLVVVPLGLVSGILSLVLHGLPLAGLNQAAADAFLAVVDVFSRLPVGEWHPPAPGIPWLVCSGLFFLFGFQYLRAKLVSRLNPFEHSSRPGPIARAGTLVTGTLLLTLSVPSLTTRQGITVSFPDVGQGDSALIELTAGKRILIDGGGTRDNRFDIGRRVLAPFLWNRGITKLDLVILSHPHPDHMNGLISILQKFSVNEVWTHGQDLDLPGYDQFRRVLAEKTIPHRAVSALDPPVTLGSADLRILHPGDDFGIHTSQAYADENNRSLVVRVAVEGRVLLFPGDIGKEAEGHLQARGHDLACDLLKVPHHGSKTSSSEAFLEAARPRIAVVTVGKGNPYRHPADEVIARYERLGAQICRTDQDGAVSIRMTRNGTQVQRWSDLVLRKIDLERRSKWRQIEGINWNRLWIRTWGI